MTTINKITKNDFRKENAIVTKTATVLTSDLANVLQRLATNTQTDADGLQARWKYSGNHLRPDIIPPIQTNRHGTAKQPLPVEKCWQWTIKEYQTVTIQTHLRQQQIH